jgi:hypothetical protein
MSGLHSITDHLPHGTFAAYTDTIAFNTSGRSYKFSFEQVGSVWRAYILSQPSYGSRSTDLHPTHRNRDGNRYFVCWSPEPTSFADIKAVANSWASRTERYIDHNIPLER